MNVVLISTLCMFIIHHLLSTLSIAALEFPENCANQKM
jgi:hypothetical protein